MKKQIKELTLPTRKQSQSFETAEGPMGRRGGKEVKREGPFVSHRFLTYCEQ